MKLLICLFILLTWSVQGYGHIYPEGESQSVDSIQNKSNPPNKIQIKYGSKGWEFATEDGDYKLQFQSRLQFRFAHPGDTDPVTFDDFQKGEQNLFKINRARLKIGGNAFQPWFKYYWEYELAAGNLLDFQMMVQKYSYFSIRVGQWKARYNRERVISSGKQQLVDRSLINRPFTLDRQQGISFYGRLKGNGLADFNYWLEILTGNGRGAGTNDDLNLMYVLRGQWNFMGRLLGFTGSDLKCHKQMVGLLALAAATNRSPYTRFSQAGGGQLVGFDSGEPGQYRVNQWMVETAFMYRGFSWQQEFHWKQIDDKVNKMITTMIGNYLQFGYFFHYYWKRVPKPLEIAFRHAIYDPDTNIERNEKIEYSLVLNWFFKEHLNKLSAEISLFDFKQTPKDPQDGWRFRIQWDVSM